MKNYRNLIIWRRGIELVKSIYELIKQYPPTEKYGIISQLTRAAVSIPANIAEGSSRSSQKDFRRFLQIALGSAFEVQTYLAITREISWGVNVSNIDVVEKNLEEIIKMIHGFIRNLQIGQPQSNS